MKVYLLMTGRTEDEYIKTGFDKYLSRIRHYISFETIVIPELKNAGNLSEEQIKDKEAALIAKHFDSSDFVVLLDEHGFCYDSKGFARFLQQKMNAGTKKLMFVTGGAYGFSGDVLKKADAIVSLSKMTFSHQIVRLIFMEQFYRAMTILKNEKYHK